MLLDRTCTVHATLVILVLGKETAKEEKSIQKKLPIIYYGFL